VTPRSLLGLCLLAPILFGAGVARAQCTKDTDCKGARICERGVCVEPPAPPATAPAPAPPRPAPPPPAPAPAPAPPAAPPPPAPAPAAAPTSSPAAHAAPRLAVFETAYGSVGPVIALHFWYNGYSQGSTTSEGVRVGVHVSGYAVLRDGLHVGGYALAQQLDPLLMQYALGLSAKLGGMVAPRVWLGAAVDLGAWFVTSASAPNWVGLQLFPRLHADVAVVRLGPVRLAGFGAVGPSVVPVIRVNNNTAWLVSPQLLVGVSVGR
jgi:hypothetical protein